MRLPGRGEETPERTKVLVQRGTGAVKLKVVLKDLSKKGAVTVQGG